MKDGAIQQSNFNDYQVLRMSDLPEIHTKIVTTDNPPTGMGEIGVVAVAPAIGNAMFQLTGKRLRAPADVGGAGEEGAGLSTPANAVSPPRLAGDAAGLFLPIEGLPASSRSTRSDASEGWTRSRVPSKVRPRHLEQGDAMPWTTRPAPSSKPPSTGAWSSICAAAPTCRTST